MLDGAVTGFIILLHLLCLLGWYTFSWSGLVLMFFFAWVTGCLGITLGFHRLLTHTSFKCPRFVRYFLSLCGCLAWQGSPVQWVGTHRLHHSESDQEGDPHTPKHGFNWAHIGWNLFRTSKDFKFQQAASDLMKDPFLRFMHRWFAVPQFILAGVLFALGYYVGEGRLGLPAHAQGGIFLGTSWVIWGVAIRTVVVWHGTWFVNSAGHTWGYKNFRTKDDSRNTWWVAMLSFGEGWHNNHHAFQRSAAHGLKWWEFDMTYFIIRSLKLVGLAWDVVLPDSTAMERRSTSSPAAEDQDLVHEAEKRIKAATDAVTEAAATLVAPRAPSQG